MGCTLSPTRTSASRMATPKSISLILMSKQLLNMMLSGLMSVCITPTVLRASSAMNSWKKSFPLLMSPQNNTWVYFVKSLCSSHPPCFTLLQYFSRTVVFGWFDCFDIPALQLPWSYSVEFCLGSLWWNTGDFCTTSQTPDIPVSCT